MKTATHEQMIALREAGHTYSQISRLLNIPRSTISSACQKWDLTKDLPPKVKRYRGKIQGRDALRVSTYIREHPLATQRNVIEDLDLAVSTATLRRFFKHQGITRKTARRAPLISASNRSKRVNFAQKMLRWPVEKLRKILWSDEMTIKSYPNGERTHYYDWEVCNEKEEIVSPHVQQGGESQQFWGSLSYHAMGPLVAFDGSVTHQTYINEILEEYVVPEPKEDPALIFQHDNVPSHKAKKVTEFLKEKKITVLDWPPQSPDLSPIELIWNNLKMKLKSKKPRPRSAEDMANTIWKLWGEITDEERQKTADTFRGKLEECVRVAGFPVKYPGRFKGYQTDCHTDTEEHYSDDSYHD